MVGSLLGLIFVYCFPGVNGIFPGLMEGVIQASLMRYTVRGFRMSVGFRF